MENETVEVKRPACPNCGSYAIDKKWVKKQLKQTYKSVDFAEHANVLKQIEKGRFPPSGPIDGDISLNFSAIGMGTEKYSDYTQLVIRCTQCGHTEVFTP